MISPEQLRRYPYFANISEEALKEVAMISDEAAAETGHTIFREDDPADAMYILVDGEVDLKYTLGDGQQRVVDTIVAGELLIWSALVEPYRCQTTGVARKPCKLISIQGTKLRDLCAKNSDLGYRMMTSVTQCLATRLEGARVQLATT